MKIKIKILTILLFSFLISSLLEKNVFFAHSPKVNPGFIAGLKNLPQTLANLPFVGRQATSQSNPLAQTQNSQLNDELTKKLEQIVLRQTADGVYAGENKEENIIYIKVTKDIPAEESELKLPDGRTVKIYSSK